MSLTRRNRPSCRGSHIPGRVHSPEWVEETGWDQMPKHLVRLNTDAELHGIGETGRGMRVETVREGAAKLLGKDPEQLTLQNIFDGRSDGKSIIRAIKAGVVDCLNSGGSLVGFMLNASVAAAAGLRCWHGSGNDLGIVDTSYVHAASVAPNCTMASDLVGSWTREDDLIVEPIEFVDGSVPTPMRPGLGCELDEKALPRYLQAHETIDAQAVVQQQMGSAV